MQRRRKTKEQQSDNRRGRTECQNVGVERKVDCLAGFIVQQQDDQRALHPESKGNSGHSRQARKQDALREKLPYQSAPARSQCQPNPDLRRPGAKSRKQHVGDVHAGDKQDCAGKQHQGLQRSRIRVECIPQTSIPTRQDRTLRRYVFAVALSIVRQAWTHRFQSVLQSDFSLPLCLLVADTWLESYCAPNICELNGIIERNGDIWRNALIRAEECRRRHANDFRRDAT